MIYRIFRDGFSKSVVIGEFGTLLLAKMFIKLQHNNYATFYDLYYQDWELTADPKYLHTSVECDGISYTIYPVEDGVCEECEAEF